jgi:hypothetical protein
VHYKVFSKKKLASSGSGRQPNNRQRMKKIPMFEFPVLSIARITSVLPSCPHIQSLPPSAFRLPPSAFRNPTSTSCQAPSAQGAEATDGTTRRTVGGQAGELLSLGDSVARGCLAVAGLARWAHPRCVLTPDCPRHAHYPVSSNALLRRLFKGVGC